LIAAVVMSVAWSGFGDRQVGIADSLDALARMMLDDLVGGGEDLVQLGDQREQMNLG